MTSIQATTTHVRTITLRYYLVLEINSYCEIHTRFQITLQENRPEPYIKFRTRHKNLGYHYIVRTQNCITIGIQSGSPYYCISLSDV